MSEKQKITGSLAYRFRVVIEAMDPSPKGKKVVTWNRSWVDQGDENSEFFLVTEEVLSNLEKLVPVFKRISDQCQEVSQKFTVLSQALSTVGSALRVMTPEEEKQMETIFGSGGNVPKS